MSKPPNWLPPPLNGLLLSPPPPLGPYDPPGPYWADARDATVRLVKEAVTEAGLSTEGEQKRL